MIIIFFFSVLLVFIFYLYLVGSNFLQVNICFSGAWLNLQNAIITYLSCYNEGGHVNAFKWNIDQSQLFAEKV